MKRRLTPGITLCLALACGLFLQGCAKQQPASGRAGFAGVYALVSIDGKEVPATVTHGGVGLRVISGTFTINGDGTCNSKTVFVPPAGTEITRDVNASYTVEGAKLTMQWEGAGMTIGTVEGRVFTMDNEGMVFVYRK